MYLLRGKKVKAHFPMYQLFKIRISNENHIISNDVLSCKHFSDFGSKFLTEHLHFPYLVDSIRFSLLTLPNKQVGSITSWNV